METFDSVIIGAGPAGLSASIYLTRLARTALVVTNDEGRLENHQINENYLGFPKGISARELAEKGKLQAKKFGVVFRQDEIENIKKNKTSFLIKGKKSSFKARTIVFATGVKDLYPSFDGVEHYIGRSLFWCLICDACKVKNKRVAVIGHDDLAVTTCMRLLNFTSDIVLLTNCEPKQDQISEMGKKKLKKMKIPCIEGSIVAVKGSRGMVKKVVLDSGVEIATKFLFSKQGYVPKSDLAASLGTVIEGEGFIKVDDNQQTNIEGVYAAGDVAHNSKHQIIIAAAQGATAAIHINELLLKPYQKDL